MKFISWNVNGLRAVVGKGFDEIFKALDADFFCLQETKMQAGQLDLEFEGYRSYWNYAEKKGYSGTAIYSHLSAYGVLAICPAECPPSQWPAVSLMKEAHRAKGPSLLILRGP